MTPRGKSIFDMIEEQRLEARRMLAAALDSPGATISRGGRTFRISKAKLSPAAAAKLNNTPHPPKENNDG